VFKDDTIREFESLLRDTMLEAGGRGMNLFRKVTNEETLLGI
jgi:hypothetical protein